jgi:hypothetical protein
MTADRGQRACVIKVGIVDFSFFCAIILLIIISNKEVVMQAEKEIEQRRDAILEEMRQIRSMERGSITEQYMKVHHKGKKEPVMRGPYYMLSRREDNRTVGYRLRTQRELERARRDVETHKRFERLGEIERADKGDEVEKKRRRSPSSRTRK